MSDAKKPGLPMPSIIRPPLKTTTSEGATQAPPPMPPSATERKPEVPVPAALPAPGPLLPSGGPTPRILDEVGKGEGKRHGVPRGRFSRARKKAIVSDALNRVRKLTTMLTPQEDEDLWDLAWAEGLTASSFAREVLVNYLERNKARVDGARQLRSQLGLQVSAGPSGKEGLAATA